MTIHQAEENIRQALEDYGAHTSQHDILEDVSETFIETLARDSVDAKQELRDLFSKSPVWNPDLDALVINGTRTHNPDYDRIYALGMKILRPAIAHETDSHRCRLIDLSMELFANPNLDDYGKDKCIEAINELAPKAYAPGKKLSRVFKAVCVALGVADEAQGSDFQRLYAMFADELSAKKIDFKLYVSINAAHFVTMSNPKGDNRGSTLTSCHSFNSTSYTYNCGCAGYARDEVTFIAFTVDDPTNPESFNNRKTTRQIFAYRPGSGLLLQSRMYNTEGGVYGAAADSSLYRDLIQREISMLENQPNLWKTYHSYDSEYCGYVQTGCGFGGYEDWIYDNFDGHISFRADCDRDHVKPLEVGTYGLCVKCGEEIDEGMYCEDCRYDYTCDDCGEGCNDTFRVYNPRGHEIYVCQHCLDNHYTMCDRCGEYCANEAITNVDGDDYCDDCIGEVAEQCDHCGEWHMRDDMISIVCLDGSTIYYVCEDCESGYEYEICPHCGERVEIRRDGTCPVYGAVVNEEEKEEEAV